MTLEITHNCPLQLLLQILVLDLLVAEHLDISFQKRLVHRDHIELGVSWGTDDVDDAIVEDGDALADWKVGHADVLDASV